MHVPQKFVSLFFSAGLSGAPKPLKKNQKYVRVIADLKIVKGDLKELKNRIFGTTDDKKITNKVRFIWLNRDYYLMVISEDSIQKFIPYPVFNFTIKKQSEIENEKKFCRKLFCYSTSMIKNMKDLIKKGKEYKDSQEYKEYDNNVNNDINSDNEKFERKIVALNQIFNFGGIKEEYFFVITKNDEKTPINEIHLKKHVKGQAINSNSMYTMSSDLMLKRDDNSQLLVFIRRSKVISIILRNPRK